MTRRRIVFELFGAVNLKRTLAGGATLLAAMAALLPWPHPLRVTPCQPVAWEVPLDVVYDASGRIQAIFTSYE